MDPGRAESAWGGLTRALAMTAAHNWQDAARVPVTHGSRNTGGYQAPWCARLA